MCGTILTFFIYCYSINARRRSRSGHSEITGSHSHRTIGADYRRLVRAHSLLPRSSSDRSVHSAVGNPDSQKVGAFGVGACETTLEMEQSLSTNHFQVFSACFLLRKVHVCHRVVSCRNILRTFQAHTTSGEEMKFLWNENQV